MHVLVVEDDARLGRLMKRVMEEEAHVVELQHDGRIGLEFAQTGPYDVIVLDLMLPSMDGIEVCRQLRAAQVDTPVLMLTARTEVDDRVRGLDAGADDYLAKPFSFAELLARVRALGRRRPLIAAEILSVEDLRLDPVRHFVVRGHEEIELTPKEFALLEYLMRHEGQVLSRQQLLDHVWGYSFSPLSNVVDIYIHYLRNKVDGRSDRKLIRTVRGLGYKLQGSP